MEDDGEIEYLEEDEEVVQQYVQNVPDPLKIESLLCHERIEQVYQKQTPLLVERKIDTRRKSREEEPDSDYDPNEDLMLERQARQKRINAKRQRANRPVRIGPIKTPSHPKPANPTPAVKRSVHKVYKSIKTDPALNCIIKIPDFEDPLCLPVKAEVKDANDLKKLKCWNKLCLDHLQKLDKPLLTASEVVSSTRSVALRNMDNRQIGKTETTVWSKLTVQNARGEKKSELFQYVVLPKYRERRMLGPFSLGKPQQKPFHHKYEVILQKEEHKDGEALVVYKPKEALSYVFMRDDKKKGEIEDDAQDKEKPHLVLKQMARCKMCAPCYQLSWRGVQRRKHTNVKCPVCTRTYVSIYNLLSHLNKHHTPEEVRSYKTQISEILAEIVDYHYKCRICHVRFPGIKELKRHIPTHQGTEVFKCEVGNHMAT